MTDYLINNQEPETIQNKMWFTDEGEIVLKETTIERPDLLRFINWIIENLEHPEEVLSECFPQDMIRDYAIKNLNLWELE
jgi:hypothetical protein